MELPAICGAGLLSVSSPLSGLLISNLSAVSVIDTRLMVGNRIVVTGMAGAGKSTFSWVLSTKTGLPVIHLDLHSWNPGWVPVPEGEFLEKQRALHMRFSPFNG